MKALLWKEYRQARKVLGGVCIILLLPYVIALVVGFVEHRRDRGEYDYSTPVGWSEILSLASLFSLLLLVVGCAFISGNAVAGERADRSAEFSAYLPISRRSAIASKAIMVIGTCLVLALVNLLIAYAAVGAAPPWLDPDGLTVGVATATLILGVAWLFSTLLKSPANATALGIAAAILVFGTLALTDYLRAIVDEPPPTLERWYVTSCFTLGAAGFITGVVYYVRRVEP